MNARLSRMQFLRGDFKGKNTPLRPPWAMTENIFLQLCTQCGDCIEQCPTHIINIRDHYPSIDFSKGECLFCEQCVDVCKTSALNKNNSKQPWQVKADIDNKICIAYQGIECRACYDPCEPQAIKMPPQLGGISTPQINDDCNGCGACVSVCPVRATSIQPTVLSTI